MSENEEQARDTGVKDLSYWDKSIIIVAALLTMCGFAFLFKPSLGVAIDKVITAPVPAPVQAVAPPQQPSTPGVVETFLYTTPAKKPGAPKPAEQTSPDLLPESSNQ